MALEGFLDVLGGGGADALVDRQCLLQVRGGLAGVAFPEVALADSFQSTRLFWERVEVAGGGQRLEVILAGLLGGRGSRGKFAEAVERFGLAEQAA